MNKIDNDEICIVWHIDDVLQQRPSLTKEQARTVLIAVKNNHNASIGVNWEEIDFWIEECFPETPEIALIQKDREQS